MLGHLCPHLFLIQAPENGSEPGAMETCLSLTEGMLRILRCPHLSENLGSSGPFLNHPYTWELFPSFSLSANSELFWEVTARISMCAIFEVTPEFSELGVLSQITPCQRCASLTVLMLVFYNRLQNLRQYLRGCIRWR